MEGLLESWIGVGGLSVKQEEEKLLALGEVTKAFGVYLTEEEAREVAVQHRESLKKAQRVEFDQGPLELIVRTFCGSIHISREEWAGALETATELFYLAKNETWDRVGDEELIRLLFKAFEEGCNGSFELLESEMLPRLGQFVRAGGDPSDFVLPERMDRWEA